MRIMNKTDWLEIIEKRHSSGISINSWCEQNGLNHSTYQYWTRKFKDEKREWSKIIVDIFLIYLTLMYVCQLNWF